MTDRPDTTAIVANLMRETMLAAVRRRILTDVHEEYEEIVRSRLGPVEPRIVGLSRWSQDDLIRRIFAEDDGPCANCERCTWNKGPDCGVAEHPHCPTCGHCRGRHNSPVRPDGTNASGTSATWPTTTFTNQPPKETPNA